MPLLGIYIGSFMIFIYGKFFGHLSISRIFFCENFFIHFYQIGETGFRIGENVFRIGETVFRIGETVFRIGEMVFRIVEKVFEFAKNNIFLRNQI